MACAGGQPQNQEPPPERTAALREAILALPGPGDPAEAAAIARSSLLAAERLSARYGMVWPPLLHNNLVHLGLRPRGLCCHWAEDMLRAVEATPLHHYRTWWLVAYLGNRVREHNTPAIAPVGSSWEDALVLDGWRDSGRLFFGPVSGDRYPWTLHPLDRRRDILRCMDE